MPNHGGAEVPDVDVEEPIDEAPSPEAMLDEKRMSRTLLHSILQSIPDEPPRRSPRAVRARGAERYAEVSRDPRHSHRHRRLAIEGVQQNIFAHPLPRMKRAIGQP